MPLVPSWPRPMSLRLRIALAFAVLVLTSATCTILIGNAIFGRKARELAQARLELDLEVVRGALRARAVLAGWLVRAGETEAIGFEGEWYRLVGSSERAAQRGWRA